MRHSINLISQVMPEKAAEYQKNLQMQVEGFIVDIVENHSDIAFSLKSDKNAIRPCDIRDDATNKIVVKLFIRWHAPLECWHVMAEGGEEKHWEKGQVEPNIN